MTRLYLLMLILILTACGSGEDKEVIKPEPQPKPLITSLSSEDTGNSCTWWQIPQNYGGITKYGGPLCTYTHKHVPLAVSNGSDLFFTTTDNTQDDNFYVYAHKNGEKVLVHQIDGWEDPHTNASIQLDTNGHVMVHVASRGLDFKFQSGKILKSKTPHELDFECIDGCDSVNFEAYPQVYQTDFGYYVGYTHYVKDPDIHASRNVREIWYRLNGARTRIAKGAHYQNTFYYDGNVYTFFNYLKNASADSRYNLFALKTSDGVNWTNLNGDPITLPVEQNDESILVYETESKNTYVYLKDTFYDENGVRFLFTESDSSDPTTGTRTLKEYRNNEVHVVSETNHNYSSGAYVRLNDKTYIIANTNDGSQYLGGMATILNGEDYSVIDVLTDNSYSYIRRIHGIDGLAVAGKGESSTFINSQHALIKVEQK